MTAPPELPDVDRADLLFHALSDRTRREILRTVLAEERSVSALAAAFPTSFAAVQKHVAVLARAGLVRKRAAGREQRVSGDPEAVRDVHRLLDALELRWRERLSRFEALLEEDPEPR